MKVVIIGGGPAGMMAAIACKRNYPNNEVNILEKNASLGKKLLITGKGRCNITSSLPIKEFISNIPGNGAFLYSAFQNYTNLDMIKFLEKKGVKVKTERGNRVFPLSDKAQDVLNAFEKELKQLQVKVLTNCLVTKIHKTNESSFIIQLENKENIKADKLILATGGKSYPLTGSTGDGYRYAEEMGHTIMPIKASLVPFMLQEIEACQSMQGLSLKNIAISIKDMTNNKKIYEDFGEMLFTHFGVSGPTILSGSAHVIRYKRAEDLMKEKKIKLTIDMKPALTEKQLHHRILRDFEVQKNKEFKNALGELLPQKMINYIIQTSGIQPEKKVNEITKQERNQLVRCIKNMEFTITGTRPVEEGIITCGGINTKEINPKTMESKLIKNLYFAGEIIDVDAYTGGFNLQIAYSTGYTAGLLQ